MIAGNSSVPASCIWYSRWTPVVVSSVTPRIPSAMPCQTRVVLCLQPREQREHDPPLLRVAGRRLGPAPRRRARTRRPCARRASRRHRRRGSCSGRRADPSASAGHRSACSVHHQYSSSVSPFHANTGTPASRDRGRRVILGREDVARRPADLGAERRERLDQHRGLHRHVQRTGDAGAGERLRRAGGAPAWP